MILYNLWYPFLIILLSYLSSITANSEYLSSLQQINVQNDSFTVTSFQYNPSSASSEWVDRIFGSKSIFYPHRTMQKIISNNPMTKEEMLLGIAVARNSFNLPSTAIWPVCSIEILGYGLLGVSHPILDAARYIGPSFGIGKLTISLPFAKKDPIVSCYYRAVYENWRLETSYTNPNYWAILVFCPIQTSSTCKKLEDQTENGNNPVTMSISIQLETVTWTALFSGRLKSPRRPMLPQNHSDMNRTATLPHLGVCLTIPYTTADDDKRNINKALLLDWVRYYLKLGFTVMIYDRDGNNYDAIFRSKRYKLPDHVIKNQLAYHNYTIRGLLDLSKRGMRYDNSELKIMNSGLVSTKTTEGFDRRSRFESQGHDKTLTSTHCRFEAKSVYGIDTVIVADFDEFLYCPFGGHNRSSQSHYIKLYFHHHRKQGVDQITIPQRFLTNKTISTRNCIKSKVNDNQSIFDCFAPYYYYMGGHSVKSAHLGHKCPLTGYHQSCPMNEAPRSYDCLCVNKNLRHILPWRGRSASQEGRECGFVHVSLDDGNYVKFTYSPEEVKTFQAEPNEIGLIIHAEDW